MLSQNKNVFVVRTRPPPIWQTPEWATQLMVHWGYSVR